MRNVTVNAWNSSSIIFSPQNCSGSGWDKSFNEGGSDCYRNCTLSTETPSAQLSFTGSAVYYISSYFNDQSINFYLDGVFSADVQLAPPTGTSANSNISRVMWYAEGLREEEHTLELFPANNGTTLSVDTIIFTTKDTIGSSSLLTPSTSISTIPSVTANASTASSAHVVLDNQTIGLIIGVISGSISGLILLGLLVMMCNRRRNLNRTRRYTSFSAGSIPGRSYNSQHQRTQRSQIITVPLNEASISKSPEPVRPLPIPQRAGSSAVRQVARSPPHVELDLGENQWQSEVDRMNQLAMISRTSPYGSNLPKLEPLRKSST